MCVIIDTNSLGNVFNEDSLKHHMFKPVLNWILDGNGKVVYGGTKYIEEIGENYLKLFGLLRSARKAVLCDETEVDDEAVRVSKMIQHSNFDDQHIVGLLIVSGCRLICTEDKRGHKYFTHRMFFPSRKLVPKIYSGNKKHRKLLNDFNIANICLPCVTISKKQSKLFLQAINS